MKTAKFNPCPLVDTQAFRMEELRSEKTRIKWTIGVLLVIVLWVMARRLTFHTQANHRLWLLAIPVLGGAILYELTLLVLVGHRIRRRLALAGWAWLLNGVIESLFPSLVLLILTQTPEVGPYRALVVPAVYL